MTDSTRTVPDYWKPVTELQTGDRFEVGTTVVEVISRTGSLLLVRRQQDGCVGTISPFGDQVRMVPAE